MAPASWPNSGTVTASVCTGPAHIHHHDWRRSPLTGMASSVASRPSRESRTAQVSGTGLFQQQLCARCCSRFAAAAVGFCRRWRARGLHIVLYPRSAPLWHWLGVVAAMRARCNLQQVTSSAGTLAALRTRGSLTTTHTARADRSLAPSTLRQSSHMLGQRVAGNNGERPRQNEARKEEAESLPQCETPPSIGSELHWQYT